MQSSHGECSGFNPALRSVLPLPVHQNHLVLLLAAAMATALDPSHNLASERSSIESTYELTKYLEYQLKEIKDVYLTYLGPPFNEKDFSPPRPNSTALTLPSAATRLELWHGLENQARLAQNQKAYSVLLAAVRELARSTLCPSLKTSLLHFCTGLDGLLGSISALMTTLGYALPPSSSDIGSDGPTMNDFARKVEGFWILRELQSWLWRSAKDFNRLKKRLRG
ncbi:cardiotrophin-like cytokine factor 1 [Thunnus maccoyii]|uniref:cardiotrophin-like cytokine factor 1 n=1 Tax=Thunnus maccoyii TaxID=8240 RepID=UPI001C4AB76E|nr:cardiotrophin-like cytokine factor 1 [Thunnus maccoyii]